MGLLSSLFGGSSKKSTSTAYTPVSAPAFPDISTTGYGGMGYNTPDNPMSMGSVSTGQGLTAPSWMNNWFSMPEWGQQAPNVGAAILQQQDPEAYGLLKQPAQQQQDQGTSLDSLLQGYNDWSRQMRPLSTFSFGSNYDTGGLPSVTKTPYDTSFSNYLQYLQQPDWVKQLQMSGRVI